MTMLMMAPNIHSLMQILDPGLRQDDSWLGHQSAKHHLNE